MIELRQLRYFLAAAEQGSFRKAGVALAVQESSVSRRIRDLEDQLGASLFQRHSGGVFLTLAGRKFLHQARTAMKYLSEGVEDVGAIGRCVSGHLRVGILSSLASGFLYNLFRAYEADRPGVRVAFSDGLSIEHLAAVRLNRLDIAFVTGTTEHAGCEVIPLWSEQIFAVMPFSHPLAERSLLDWPDLAGEKFIFNGRVPGREVQDVLISRLVNSGRHPQIHRHNVCRNNLMSLVAMGRGLALTSEAMTSITFNSLVYRPIDGEGLLFSAIFSPKNDNPALRRLVSLARNRRCLD